MPNPPVPIPSAVLDAVNLRSAPAIDPANVLTVLPKGTAVMVHGNAGDWLLVAAGASVGFVKITLVAPALAGAVAWTAAVEAPDGANLRSGPSTSKAKVGSAAHGAALAVTGFDGGWLRVEQGATVAWVRASLVATDPGATPPVVGPPPARLAADAVRARLGAIRQVADPVARGDAFEVLQTQAPYASQRDNASVDAGGHLVEVKTGTMCNLTALAMCLTVLGVPNPEPARQLEDVLESIRVARGLPSRSTAAGWGGVANAMGANVSFVRGGDFREGADWWRQHARPRLRDGQALMMSITGHIVRVTAVTGAGLVVDDPYGESVLLAGSGHGWGALNPYQKPGGTVGADRLWPWSAVQAHDMHWLAAISVPVGLELPGPAVFAPLPALVDPEASNPKLLGRVRRAPRG